MVSELYLNKIKQDLGQAVIEPVIRKATKIRVGDCSVRALCRATGKPWDFIHSMLCAISSDRHDMPSANHVWGAYLRSQGFKRYIVDDHDMAIEKFSRLFSF